MCWVLPALDVPLQIAGHLDIGADLGLGRVLKNLSLFCICADGPVRFQPQQPGSNEHGNLWH